MKKRKEKKIQHSQGGKSGDAAAGAKTGATRKGDSDLFGAEFGLSPSTLNAQAAAARARSKGESRESLRQQRAEGMPLSPSPLFLCSGVLYGVVGLNDRCSRRIGAW